MREHKYRAWHKEDRRMYPVKTISLDDYQAYVKTGECSSGDIGKYVKPSEIELIEYTGLKDKDNFEIYEGDWVRDDQGRETVVEWDDLMTGWIPFHCSLQPLLREYEIIGNIGATQ